MYGEGGNLFNFQNKCFWVINYEEGPHQNTKYIRNLYCGRQHVMHVDIIAIFRIRYDTALYAYRISLSLPFT